VELLYLSSVLYKFDEGGYLPLAFSAFLMVIMFIWNDVYRRKYYYELDHKVSPTVVKEIIDSANVCRIPGFAIFYSELVQGIPPIFKHYAENVPALHSVLVFVSIKSLPISKVPVEERFLFRRVQPNELNVFRCVVRYGYTDTQNEQEPFERILVERLKEFIRDDSLFSAIVQTVEEKNGGEESDDETDNGEYVNIEGKKVNNERQIEAMGREIEVLDTALHAGVVHLMGENEVIAAKGANIGKKVVIDYAYNFIRRNLRQTEKVFHIPHQRLLKVGMTYEL
jgi:KUP system potassium uptake protein